MRSCHSATIDQRSGVLTLALEAVSVMLLQQTFDTTLEANVNAVRILDASGQFPLPLVQLAGDQGTGAPSNPVLGASRPPWGVRHGGLVTQRRGVAHRTSGRRCPVLGQRSTRA